MSLRLKNMRLKEVLRTSQEAIAANPAVAQAAIKAHCALADSTRVLVNVGSGKQLIVDEPETLGGGNTGASPVEYALAALGSCQAITYRFWAAKLGITLDSVIIKVEGDLDLRGFFGIDDAVRAGFGAVRLRVELTGPEPPARYLELAQAVDTHCPVLDIFRNAVAVERELIGGGFPEDER